MMKQKKKNNEHKFDFRTIVIAILAIIVVLLCLKSCATKEYAPTGNIDIFDIKCDCPDGKDCPEPVKPVVVKPGKQEQDDDKDKETGLIVDDGSIKWKTISELRVFTNPAYVIDGAIAPGMSNSYVFRIRNNNAFDVIYDIRVAEENEKNINIRYRLKFKGRYLFGDDNTWVSANQLDLSDIPLSSTTYDEYELEWNWIESDNDTAVGLLDNVKYKLSIAITGVEV